MSPAKRTPSAKPSAPTFRELSREECDALLARNHVGRVAFSFHDRVDLEPVHYVYAEGWLNGRTAMGAKVAVLRHHPWVAFEVDEVEGLFDWRSVVVHGVVEMPAADGSPADRDAYERILAHIREVLPSAFSDADPAPERILPFRIHVDTISGRAATTTRAKRRA
jgi:uncharacterized protein